MAARQSWTFSEIVSSWISYSRWKHFDPVQPVQLYGLVANGLAVGVIARRLRLTHDHAAEAVLQTWPEGPGRVSFHLPSPSRSRVRAISCSVTLSSR
jgi:hypothetical protein